MFIEIMPPTIPAPEERHLLGHEYASANYSAPPEREGF